MFSFTIELHDHSKCLLNKLPFPFDFQISMNASLIPFPMNIYILLTTVTLMQIAQTPKAHFIAHAKLDSPVMGSLA